MKFQDSLKNRILNKKEYLLNYFKGVGNDKRIPIGIFTQGFESIPENDPTDSTATRLAEDLKNRVILLYIDFLNHIITNTYRIQYAAFNSGFQTVNLGENEYEALTTGIIPNVSSILKQKNINTENLDPQDKENAIYLIEKSKLPYLESNNDDIFISIPYMNDTNNQYVAEMIKRNPRQWKEHCDGRLLVVDLYLEIVYNSKAQVIKILIDEEGTDTIESINSYINHL